jgi:hypothetical protein
MVMVMSRLTFLFVQSDDECVILHSGHLQKMPIGSSRT